MGAPHSTTSSKKKKRRRRSKSNTSAEEDSSSSLKKEAKAKGDEQPEAKSKDDAMVSGSGKQQVVSSLTSPKTPLTGHGKTNNGGNFGKKQKNDRIVGNDKGSANDDAPQDGNDGPVTTSSSAKTTKKNMQRCSSSKKHKVGKHGNVPSSGGAEDRDSKKNISGQKGSDGRGAIQEHNKQEPEEPATATIDPSSGPAAVEANAADEEEGSPTKKRRGRSRGKRGGKGRGAGGADREEKSTKKTPSDNKQATTSAGKDTREAKKTATATATATATPPATGGARKSRSKGSKKKLEKTGTRKFGANQESKDPKTGRDHQQRPREEGKAEAEDDDASSIDSCSGGSPCEGRREERSKKKRGRESSTVTDGEDAEDEGSPKKKHRRRGKRGGKGRTSPLVDMTVHRLRNLQYEPRSILCIRSAPAAVGSSGNGDAILGVSRDNGSVELRSASDKFRIISVVAGAREKPVSVMAWTTTVAAAKQTKTALHLGRPILVGGSDDGSLFIVDFEQSRLTAVTSSGGGAVFSLAAAPIAAAAEYSEEDSSAPAVLAAGCEDGSIRILEARRNHLEVVSTIPTAGAPVLSLAWHGSAVLYAGIADGTIRRYERTSLSLTASDRGKTAKATKTATRTPSWKSALRMTVECRGRNTPTRVWALAALEDGTVVSGDSLGNVQFWDGGTGTLLQTVPQNDLSADVLDLAASGDGCQVYATGVDSRVACIERPVQRDERKWVATHSQRPHTHDVRSVAICRRRRQVLAEGEENRVDDYEEEVLVTGGIDTKLCSYLTGRNFSRRRPKIVYPWPASSPASVAPGARALTMLRDDRAEVYRLLDAPQQQNKIKKSKQDTSAAGSVWTLRLPRRDPAPVMIGTVQIKSTWNLQFCAVSPNGRYLAASDAERMYLFRLNTISGPAGTTVLPAPVALEKGDGGISGPVVAMEFASDRRLVVCEAGEEGNKEVSIRVVSFRDDGGRDDVATSCQAVLHAKGATVKSDMGTDGGVKVNTEWIVESVSSSADGQWLAVRRFDLSSSSVGGGGRIDVFRYRDEGQGSYGHWWTLPSLDVTPSAMRFLVVPSFSSSSGTPPPQQLAVAGVNYACYVFDIERRRLSPWSEEAGFPVSDRLPPELTARHDYPVRICVDPGTPSKLFMASFGAIVAVDLDKGFFEHCRTFPNSHVRGHHHWHKKRKRGDSVSSSTDAHRGQDAGCAALCLRYNCMVFSDFVGEKEMVVAEQPWLSVVAAFPPALQRRIYGS